MLFPQSAKYYATLLQCIFNPDIRNATNIASWIKSILNISTMQTTAEQIFQTAGLKSTQSRLEVTSILAQNKYPMSHQEILKQLPESFDRVTLYRVLDWLLNNNVIHRIAGEDRAWRFHINESNAGDKKITKFTHANTSSKSKIIDQHSHAHFQCDQCGKMFCLNDVHPQLTNNIPPEFIVDSIELNIKGKCRICQKLSS